MANANNVTAAKPKAAGALRVAPYGTPLPKTANEDLNDAFVTLGYISEDGMTNSNPIETTSTGSWGGNPVMDGEASRKDEFKQKLLEGLNANVLRVIYGDDNVEVDDKGRVIALHCNSAEHVKRSWVYEEILKGGALARTVIANGTITSLGDISHNDKDPIAYDCTISAKPDKAHKRKQKNGDVINGTHDTYFWYPEDYVSELEADAEEEAAE